MHLYRSVSCAWKRPIVAARYTTFYVFCSSILFASGFSEEEKVNAFVLGFVSIYIFT